MRPTHDATRRQALIHTGASLGAAMLAAGVSGCAGATSNDRQLVFATLPEALAELDRLTQAQPLQPATAFTWAQTLNHCAQSIEYSMAGFPASKSALFQVTAGSAALKFFAWRGRMTHDLGEPIPAAPPLDAPASAVAAAARLRQAAAAFAQWPRALRPHFAYGSLGKARYEQAHAMHLAQHFSAFQQPA